MKITNNHSYYDFFIWILVYFILVFLILLPIYSFSKGIVYPLDDVYIHLSIAKNLLQTGTWGLYINENISASSSPLYTLLLTPFTYSNIFTQYAPILINIVTSICILFVFHLFLKNLHLSFGVRVLLGIVFILIVPLPSLTVMGMEHLLHSFFVILLIYFIQKDATNQLIIILITALAIFIRLESAFLIVGISIWCFYEKKWSILLQIIIGFTLGIGFYILLSVVFSINIIPNTILLKTVVNQQAWLPYTITKVWNSKLLLFITLLSLTSLIIRWNHSKLFLVVIVTSLLHLILAKQGWFYRYEAYVVCLFFIVFVNENLQVDKQRKKIKSYLIASIFIVICTKRAFLSLTTTSTASKNIYDQQIHMSMMLFTIPQKETIAVNDIGAVSYFTSHHFIDLYGIATKEVYELKLNKKYSTFQMKKLLETNNTQYVCVYTSWFENSLFDNFKPIGTLHLENNVVCGDTIVSFFHRGNTNQININFP